MLGVLTDVEWMANDEQGSREEVQLMETRTAVLIASNSHKIERH